VTAVVVGGGGSGLGAAKCRASEKWTRVGCGRPHACRYLANL
jgi:succinate dehydrogenase/fumarate reductase flavoprotein subunit